MQHPIDFFKSLQTFDIRHRMNILREYLQVMTLQILYSLRGSEYLRFGGGTCLRICHNLPRYSEDLDFSLEKKKVDISKLMEQLIKGFHQNNVDFELSIPKNIDKKRVAKYWLKFSNLLHQVGYSFHKTEKLFVKIEIDKYPPKKGKGEFFYVTKFNQYFPIFKNDLPTLFSGKIAAVCQRGYHAMRDFYDLLWYLNQRVQSNYSELKELGIRVKNCKELVQLLREKTKKIDGKEIIKTIGGFLENEVEKTMLKNYQKAFDQAAKRYLAV